MSQETWTREEVEALITEIINQDSFGDVWYKANQVARREGMSFTKKEEKDEE